MKCPNCSFDAPAELGLCPRCGAARLHTNVGKPWDRRNAAWLIPVTILSILIPVSIAGYFGYKMFKAQLESHKLEHERPRRESGYGGVPVAHGNVVKPEELHGHGKLYFVPVGRQVISAQLLADYYLQKFRAHVTVLSEVNTTARDCVPERKQCVAEELEAEMTSAYPEIARDPNSVMIALTDEDIFPREQGWDFTYSWHSVRIGIVSTHRMDPVFFGDPPNDALRLASTKQMLTKYVAMLYFHVPISFDPTSIMYSPLIPKGGSDDLYESDLHSEDFANGLRGTPFPCLYFDYSYETHKITPEDPVLSDCKYINPVGSTKEEHFETNLGQGNFTQRSMDLQLNSTPPITLRRAYLSGESEDRSFAERSFAFGFATNHSYDIWMSSDGFESQSFMDLNQEDGRWTRLERITPGHGFVPGYTFESHNAFMYGARLTWEGDHYKLTYRDGAWSTLLPCVSGKTRCYWTGYHDAKGNTLTFDRGSGLELRQLTASDHQGITFKSDEQLRTIEATATNGFHTSYEYDANGCLARVHRADGQITIYKYDLAHQMTSVSVIRKPGARPETILTNEYNSHGRIVKQTLAGLGSYKIEYVGSRENHASEWKITTPAGQIWNIEETNEETYVVHSEMGSR